MKTYYFILLVLIVTIDAMAGIELNDKDMKQASSYQKELKTLAKEILIMAVMGNTESPKLTLSTITFSSTWYSRKTITRIDSIESENFRLKFSGSIALHKSEPEPEPEPQFAWLTRATLEKLTIPGLHINYKECEPPSIYTCPNNKYKDFSYSDKSWVLEKTEKVFKVPDNTEEHYSSRPLPLYIGDKEVIREYENKMSKWLADQCPNIRPSDAKNHK